MCIGSIDRGPLAIYRVRLLVYNSFPLYHRVELLLLETLYSLAIEGKFMEKHDEP